jgi:hypothetical protein
MGGIHPEATWYFEKYPSERPVVLGLLKDFDVTWAARREAFGSEFSVYFLRPERHLAEMFGFDREILVIRADYAKLQQRIFQAIEAELLKLPAAGRVDSMVVLVVSRASNLREIIGAQRTNNAQTRNFVPFSEADLSEHSGDAFFVRNRLREFLFTRDLFDVSQPITSDLYFFGRSSLLVDLQDGLREGKNFGLFGLRKMGKTSLIFKLRRSLEESGTGSLFYFDLQDAALYRMRWWALLDELRASMSKKPVKASADGTEAATAFREAVRNLKKSRLTVLALDEIEHISPRLRMEAHWDRDFLDLWKTLRAVQNENRHLALLVAGVNAGVLETPTYDGHDNPLFAMAQIRYMPSLEVGEIRTMVRALGRSMGLQFEEDVYPYLHERYGGHPSLTRMACSAMHLSTARESRPVVLSRQQFRSQQDGRDRNLLPFGEHVLGLLKQWYPDEYAMLEMLATGQSSFFLDMAANSPEYVHHLEAYHLVQGDPPRLRIPLLEMCLRRAVGGSESAPKGPHLPHAGHAVMDSAGADDLVTISRLRNRLEPMLRTFIKRTLKAHLGPEKWITPILKVVPTKDREKLDGVDRDKILNERLFLMNLLTVVDQNWDSYFKAIESCPPDRQATRDQFRVLLTFVNAHREDAHAKPTSSGEVAALAIACEALERSISYLLED